MAHISRLSPIFRSVSLRGRTMLAAYFAGICEVFGLNCSTRSRNLVWLHQLRVPLSTITNLFFFEGPKGRYGPRKAWAHMGWVGHPAH